KRRQVAIDIRRHGSGHAYPPGSGGDACRRSGNGPDADAGDAQAIHLLDREGIAVLGDDRVPDIAGATETVEYVAAQCFDVDILAGKVDPEFLAKLREADEAVEMQVAVRGRSEEHTPELQSRENLVCRLLLEKKNQRLSSR